MGGDETWMELHVLHRHGWSIATLAREFGLNWRTARRYAAGASRTNSMGTGEVGTKVGITAAGRFAAKPIPLERE